MSEIESTTFTNSTFTSTYDSTLNGTCTSTPSPDVDVVAIKVRGFAQKLRAARRHGGDPSLRDMVRTIENQPARTGIRQVSAATLGRALTGDKFPKWWVVEGLLVACRADQSTTVYRKIRKAWLEVAELIDPIGVNVDEFAETDDEPGEPVHLALVREPAQTRRYRSTGS
jgi:hypothetical protein